MTTPFAPFPPTDPSFLPTTWNSKRWSKDPAVSLYYSDGRSFDEFSAKCADSSAWQVRYSAHGLRSEPPRSIITIRRPLGDGITRTQEIRRFLDSGNIYEPLVISACNNCEGLSFLRPNAPDQQRKNTEQSLAIIQTEVLMMGDTELMFDGTNVRPLEETKSPSQVESLNAYSRRNGNHEIILLNLHPGSMQGAVFLDALKSKIDAIRRSSQKQPFIIGVGVLNEEDQQLLSNGDIDLDVLIDDFSGTPYVPNETVIKAAMPIVHPLRLPSVGKTSWGHLRLTFDGQNVHLKHHIFPVLSNSLRPLDPRVEALMYDVNRVRHGGL